MVTGEQTPIRFRLVKVFLWVFSFHLIMAAAGWLLIYLEGKESLHEYWVYLLQHHLPGTVFITLFLYLSQNRFYHLLAWKKNLLAFWLPVAVSLCSIMAFYIVIEVLFPTSEQPSTVQAYSQDIFFYFMGALLLIGLSLTLAYLGYLQDEKKKKHVLEQQQLTLEKEKAQAQFDFLKAQINPHFLHNTLSFLYARSLPLSSELSEAILTLSDIMRYALENDSGMNGTVALEKEIEHVQNVIKINQLRFDNKLQVVLEVGGSLKGRMIVPLVLITLVENAFKHGELRNAAQPLQIRLEVGESHVRFCCWNKKKIGPKEPSTGIGLDNIRKRLNLMYQNNYLLDIHEDKNFFKVELLIQQYD